MLATTEFSLRNRTEEWCESGRKVRPSKVMFLEEPQAMKQLSTGLKVAHEHLIHKTNARTRGKHLAPFIF